MTDLPPSVLEVADAVRLSTTGAARGEFTVARDEAVMRLRGRGHQPLGLGDAERRYGWTVGLLRAGIAMSEDASVRAQTAETGGARVTTIAIRAGADAGAGLWASLRLAGLLDAALAADRADADPAARARTLVAKAINAALACEPPWVEVSTGPVTVRFERSSEVVEGVDPYVERPVRGREAPAGLSVRYAHPEPSLSRTVARWFGVAHSAAEDLRAIWARALVEPWAGSLEQGLQLRAPQDWLDLGGFAALRPDESSDALWLVRDGASVVRIDGAVAQAGGGPEVPRGLIRCDALALDVDEAAVIADDALDKLVAWLGEHAGGGGPGVADLPDEGELMYAWPHQRAKVPPGLAARVVFLTPSVVAQLEVQRPDVRLLPAVTLGAVAAAPPVDLTSIEQGSLDPIPIPVAPFDGLPIDLEAFLHRYAPPSSGVTSVLVFDRPVARLTEPAYVVGGMTLVARVGEARFAANDHEVHRVAKHCRTAAVAAEDMLLRAALGGGARTASLVRRRMSELDGPALRLRYVEPPVEGDAVGRPGVGVRAAWDESPLLDLEIGQTRGGAARTLRAALVRFRDVGGVVVGDEDRRWFTLESKEPRFEPWVLTAAGRELIDRVLGEAALWDMPIVPEAQPRPVPLAQQPTLRLSAADIERLRPRRGSSARARRALAGHLLATHAAGENTGTLADAPLFGRFDPRAHKPRQLMSLNGLLAEPDPLALVPEGAGSRAHEAPVLEVEPGLAFLLSETLGLAAAPAIDPDATPRRDVGPAARTTAAPPRAADAVGPTLTTVPIASPLCAGALHLRPGATSGIALWARGLRVSSFRLPRPLRGLSGRMWLTDAGIRAGHDALHAVALAAGRQLLGEAFRQRRLLAPDTERRSAVDRFIASVQRGVEEGRDRAGVADLVVAYSGVTPRPGLPRPPTAAPRAFGHGPAAQRLMTAVGHGLQRPIELDLSRLRRRPAHLETPDAPRWRISLGRRHPLIAAAVREDATPAATVEAAVLIVAEVLADAAPHTRDEALLRVLACIAHR